MAISNQILPAVTFVFNCLCWNLACTLSVPGQITIIRQRQAPLYRMRGISTLNCRGLPPFFCVAGPHLDPRK
ncbi:hypothetical protein V8C44DRAFT_322436 [Trichoderma aethiopicum]